MELAQVIAAYKADFERIDRQERYKWIALEWYRTHWDLDAPDFAAMFAEAFSKANNLLAASMYYPYKMACEYARYNPEEARALFRELYDERLPLAQRYRDFRNGFKRYMDAQLWEDTGRTRWRNHYQDLHAVSVYLTFAFPEKYYLYKATAYNRFKNLVGFAEEQRKPWSEVRKLENCNRMGAEVWNAVRQDPELLEMNRRRLTENCYADEEGHLLAMDVIFFGSWLDADGGQTKETEEKETHDADNGRREGLATDVAKNTILYGPPGTGKTYSTVQYAVAAIEKRPLADIKAEPYASVRKRFERYKDEGRIETATFHQSYGYEEFVEGIRPVLERDGDELGEVRYEIASGLFKSFCDRAGQPVLKERRDLGLNHAPVVWKVSLEGTYENPTRAECLANGHIRIGWDGYGAVIGADTDFSKDGGKNVLNAFIYKMKTGDIVLSCYSNTTIDAVGIVTGEYEWHEEYDRFKRLRRVNWLVKEIREDITEANGGTAMTLSAVYKLSVSISDVLRIVEKYQKDTREVEPNTQNYVFIIDEINRGNISKIFGELITLIEPAKRIGQPEGMTVRLPYSQKTFGVPDNVYLIGTMNTADRSIAALDTALRRRFQFQEMQPDARVLADIMVEDLSIQDLFIRMNRKISILYDREHTIGHAYFMALKEDPTVETLAELFANRIVPLLQEYFYEDYEKIRLVLGDNRKTEPEEQFILARADDCAALFGGADLAPEESCQYEINREAFGKIAAYRFI